MIHIVRFYSKRLPDEGPRLGTVRRPPRGVPKTQYKRLDIYDVWLPILAPSAALIAELNNHEIAWARFCARFKKELKEREAHRILDALATMSHTSHFAVGCYCNDERHCHRSILRLLLKERGAKLAPKRPDGFE
jgi:uncharacterized protein YeaO (DUF488 family)